MQKPEKIIVKTINGTRFEYEWDEVETEVRGRIFTVTRDTGNGNVTLLIVPERNLEYIEYK